ncbi:hypothetical protein [Stenotrophomonas maltophilia]|uniref:hypothetical protein n=1 Tax=Stenotrophomonas maltophilia TaxID=40324 RepID=UPI00066CEF2D|nr:hypothetical protein [Stenotrophomonas maltophilia]MBN5116019.1 hypothetical protein [Stenotrophomonas maltophilia]
MSGYEIKVSITPLCPCCGKESQSSGFVDESRAPQGVFDRDNPYERTDQRVFFSPCPECFVFRGDVAELIDAAQAVENSCVRHDANDADLFRRLDAAIARVEGGAA